MKPYDILALLPAKPEDMPKIATISNKPTRARIKAFQEIIQDQAMYITTCDHSLGFLAMVIWASYFDPLNNRNPFAPPIDPGPTPINVTVTDAQINEVVRLYKDYKEKFTAYCGFHIILISMITNKCPEKYMTTLKHRITKFHQCEPLTLLTHLYTEYGTITSSDLTEIFDLMTARWNPPTPIADLFQQLNDRKYFAEEVN